MAVIASPVAAMTVRHGPRFWLDGFGAMLRWHLASLRMWLSLVTVIQVMAGVGFVLGIGLFFADIPPMAALYVSTGVPVNNLLMLGLIIGPQLVADQKVQQSFDYLQSLPVPRSASAAAWYAVTFVAALPAVLISLLVAQWRYDLTLHVSPSIVPAVVLTAFTGTMLGYALAYAVPSPQLTRLLSQVLIFVIFGFAPIMFPPEQMPAWLADLNWWLPFEHMAVIVRGGLTEGLVTDVGVSYAIVGVWGLLAAGLVAVTLGRRP